MHRQIVMYPDASLRVVAEPVRTFGRDLEALAADIRDTLVATSAIGLTAVHIGESNRVVVIRMSPEEPARIYVNPTVVWTSSERTTFEEGSVSMPGVRETIERPAAVRITFQTMDGSMREAEKDGFEAAVIQHEIDQLDGIFWIDRLSRLRRDRLIRRYEKIRRVGSA